MELEEIHPDQLALFPESVRHLRKKQGALCWWKLMVGGADSTLFFVNIELFGTFILVQIDNLHGFDIKSAE